MTRSQFTQTRDCWHNMRYRCENSKQPHHVRIYRNRGIGVCQRWASFDSFLSDMGLRPAGTTLDRIDGNRGYEPGNCRWVTPLEQAHNTRANVRITHAGRTLCIAEWAREIGIHSTKLSWRLRAGWPLAQALSPENGTSPQFRPRAPRVGEDSARSKITTAQARAVLAGLAQGQTQVSIARELGISRHIVVRIATGKTWRHVAMPPEASP
jgi:hypothetical protein